MGLERLVEEQPQDYIGKDALERIRREGVDRKLVGIVLDGDELRAEMSEKWPVHKDGKVVGHMTDAVWSPGLKQNIGYVWVPIELAEPGTTLDVESENGAAHRHDRGDPVRRPEEGGPGRQPAVTRTRRPEKTLRACPGDEPRVRQARITTDSGSSPLPLISEVLACVVCSIPSMVVLALVASACSFTVGSESPSPAAQPPTRSTPPRCRRPASPSKASCGASCPRSST